jgi:ubiquinone biosynthesis protein COQ4
VNFAKTLVRRYHAARCYVILAKDPGRLDVVFGLRTALRDEVQLAQAIARLEEDPYHRAVIAERRRMKRIDLAALAALPVGTLGRTFAENMRAQGLDPADLPHLDAPDAGSFLSAHLYETHDIWHTVTGFSTDIPGELGLQAFYSAQLAGPLPIAILSAGLLNTLLFAMDDREARMDAIVRGWTLGRRARPLFGRAWDDLWTTPLAEVREALGLGSLEHLAHGAHASERLAA